MESYRSARHAQELRAEAASAGYASELADFYAGERPVTFREWLQHYARDRRTA